MVQGRRVHRGLGPAHEGLEARQGVGVGQPLHVLLRVQRLDRDALGRVPVEGGDVAPGADLAAAFSQESGSEIRQLLAHDGTSNATGGPKPRSLRPIPPDRSVTRFADGSVQIMFSPTTVRPRLLGVDEHTSLAEGEGVRRTDTPGRFARPSPEHTGKAGAGAIGEREISPISRPSVHEEMMASDESGIVCGRAPGRGSGLAWKSRRARDAEHGGPSSRRRWAYRRPHVTPRGMRHGDSRQTRST